MNEVDSALEVGSSSRKKIDILESVSWLKANGPMDLAVDILRGALAEDPEDSDYLGALLEVLRDQGREAEISEHIAPAILEKVAVLQFGRANLLYASGQDEAALEAYRLYLKSMDRDPKRLFESYKNIGNVYVKFGDYDLASDFYNKAYLLEPKSLDLLVNYGTLEIQKDRLDKAREHFGQALAIDSSASKAWVGLALIHRSMGDLDLAWGNLLKAFEGAKVREVVLKLAFDWATKDRRVDHLSSMIENLNPQTPSEQDFITQASWWIKAYYKEITEALENDWVSASSRGRPLLAKFEGALVDGRS